MDNHAESISAQRTTVLLLISGAGFAILGQHNLNHKSNIGMVWYTIGLIQWIAALFAGYESGSSGSSSSSEARHVSPASMI